MSIRRIHIVQLVENDEAVRCSIALFLEAAGYEVRAHVSGDAFLTDLDRPPREVHPTCVLLDLQMPGRSGLEVQVELQRRHIRWPVVILTGRADVGVAIQAMKNGAFDFLEKSHDNDTLLETLEQAFTQSEQSLGQGERVAHAHELIAKLTQRECQVMRALLGAMTNKLIAYELDLSVRTVEIYRAKVMAKLRVRGLSAAVRMAIDAGMEPLSARLRA